MAGRDAYNMAGRDAYHMAGRDAYHMDVKMLNTGQVEMLIPWQA